jgi:hypothetical protein
MGHFKTCEQATIRIHAITIPSGPPPRNHVGRLCHNFARVCAGRITGQWIVPAAASASGEMV